MLAVVLLWLLDSPAVSGNTVGPDTSSGRCQPCKRHATWQHGQLGCSFLACEEQPPTDELSQPQKRREQRARPAGRSDSQAGALLEALAEIALDASGVSATDSAGSLGPAVGPLRLLIRRKSNTEEAKVINHAGKAMKSMLACNANIRLKVNSPTTLSHLPSGNEHPSPPVDTTGYLTIHTAWLEGPDNQPGPIHQAQVLVHVAHQHDHAARLQLDDVGWYAV